MDNQSQHAAIGIDARQAGQPQLESETDPFDVIQMEGFSPCHVGPTGAVLHGPSAPLRNRRKWLSMLQLEWLQRLIIANLVKRRTSRRRASASAGDRNCCKCCNHG